MKRTRILGLILSLAILAGFPVITAYAESEITVTINGKEQSFEVPPQLINERTMVPMRAIFEAMGARVQWEESTQTITATAGDRVITMQLDNNVMTVDGTDVVLDVPPQLVNSRTLVPVRAVAEGLDAAVNWIGSTQTVVILQPLAERPASDSARAAIFGYGNSRLNEVQFDSRYTFEQEVLPQAVYLFVEDLVDLISAKDLDEITNFVHHFWSIVEWYSIAYDLDETGQLEGVEDEEALVRLVSRLKPDYGLSEAEQILDIAIETLASGVTAVVLDMSDTGWTMLSTFIAIVFVEDLGIAVFTLERSIVDDLFVLCHVGWESRGVVNAAEENSREAFIKAIIEFAL